MMNLPELPEPDLNERADEAFAERKLLGVTDEEWDWAMRHVCAMAANGSKLGASILLIRAVREAVKQERELCAKAIEALRMTVYLLKRHGDIGYDEFGGFVVYAESEEYARNIAARAKGDEGSGVWTDPKASTCEALGFTTNKVEARVVLGSFNAG